MDLFVYICFNFSDYFLSVLIFIDKYKIIIKTNWSNYKSKILHILKMLNYSNLEKYWPIFYKNTNFFFSN